MIGMYLRMRLTAVCLKVAVVQVVLAAGKTKGVYKVRYRNARNTRGSAELSACTRRASTKDVSSSPALRLSLIHI